MKTCCVCNKSGEFYTHKRKDSNLVYEEKQCKECRKKVLKEYRNKNKKKCNLVSRRWSDNKRFGRPREEIMKDKCEICGSKKRLSIHHKDGKGRGSNLPNNKITNFQTLCNSCHCFLHAKKNAKKYNKELQKEVIRLWEGRSLREIGRILGVCHMTVKSIRKECKEKNG
jgi:DNA-directed RNA polymerase specialized sigma subunit